MVRNGHHFLLPTAQIEALALQKRPHLGKQGSNPCIHGVVSSLAATLLEV
jgi:hypothetical protein